MKMCFNLYSSKKKKKSAVDTLSNLSSVNFKEMVFSSGDGQNDFAQLLLVF